MEAGKPVLRIATDQRGERSNRTRIAGFQFFEGLNVGLCLWAGTFGGVKRLECADRLGPASEQEVAYGSTAKTLSLRGHAATHTKAGA